MRIASVGAAAHGRPLSFFRPPQKLKRAAVGGGPYGLFWGCCVCWGRVRIARTGRHGVRPLRGILGSSRLPEVFAYRGGGRPWAADPTGRLDDQRMVEHNYTDIHVFDVETLVNKVRPYPCALPP